MSRILDVSMAVPLGSFTQRVGVPLIGWYLQKRHPHGTPIDVDHNGVVYRVWCGRGASDHIDCPFYISLIVEVLGRIIDMATDARPRRVNTAAAERNRSWPQ